MQCTLWSEVGRCMSGEVRIEYVLLVTATGRGVRNIHSRHQHLPKNCRVTHVATRKECMWLEV
jgi:hypothetical protein